MTTLIANARLVDARRDDPGWVLLDGDRIAATGSRAAPYADTTVDARGRTLVPGFLDLHGHGGGGHAFDAGGDDLVAGLAAHRRHGTTRSVVSLVAAPVPDLIEGLSGIARLAASDPLVLGAHLEGPFLAPARRGAHDPRHLIEPTPELVDSLLTAAAGALRQVTIAPELPGAADAIARFVAAGVRVAVGHTEADAATARRAFDAGATLLTHAFNAMPGIHHRDPGPVLAAFDDARVTLELILDGVHVAPEVARLALRAAAGRVALVTDAMGAAGADDGDYRLGSLDVSVRGGVARITGTDTIAGSTLTQDAALRAALDLGLAPSDAVGALTLVPARALGLDDRFGLLEAGFAADVVLLDDTWTVQSVWAAGRALPPRAE